MKADALVALLINRVRLIYTDWQRVQTDIRLHDQYHTDYHTEYHTQSTVYKKQSQNSQLSHQRTCKLEINKQNVCASSPICMFVT